MDATRSSGTELRSAWAGARTAVFDYIETFYNAVRFHSTLGYLSRVGYEKIKEEKAA